MFSATSMADPALDIVGIVNNPISVLECENDRLIKEMDKRRRAFIDILENGDICSYSMSDIPSIEFPSLMTESTFDSDNPEFYFQEMDDTMARYHIRHTEYEVQAINEEALIFASEATDYEKFQKLQAVNEAIGNKIKRIFYNTIAKLKEIFAKFMEKLRGNFTSTKNYLDKYKDIILKKPFRNNNKYETQDLVRGINRIEKTSVPQLDLTAIDSNLLDDPAKFFESKVKPADGGAEWNNANKDQATFWKAYFCMSSHNMVYTGTSFQNNALKPCFDFLYDIRKTEKVIKKSIKDIDDTITRVMKSAGADYNKPDDNASGDQQSTNKESVVWSYLYQKPFILENGILMEFKVVPNTDDQQQGDNNTADQSFSQRMSNVDKQEGEGPDNVAAGKQNARPVIDTRCNTYVTVCSTMLKAKMSACEFIRSESMGIIRAHVQSYIGQTSSEPEPEKEEPAKKEETPKKKTWREKRAEKRAAKKAKTNT